MLTVLKSNPKRHLIKSPVQTPLVARKPSHFFRAHNLLKTQSAKKYSSPTQTSFHSFNKFSLHYKKPPIAPKISTSLSKSSILSQKNKFCSSPKTHSTAIQTAYQTQGDLIDHAWGLASYFKLPEQGMVNYELLSRGSVTFLESRLAKNPASNENSNISTRTRSLHLLAPKHVTHPFLYKDYYQQDWLSFVREEAVINYLEFRERGTGKVVKQFACNPDVIKTERDLVVLHLAQEKELYDWIAETNNFLTPVEFPFDQSGSRKLMLERGQKVDMVGHELIIPEQVDPKEDPDILLPIINSGSIIHVDDKNDTFYVKTAIPSPQGLCGGPILSESGALLGIVEALVQGELSEEKQKSEDNKKVHEYLKNTTVGIGYRVIREIITKMDDQMTNPPFETGEDTLSEVQRLASKKLLKGEHIFDGIPMERRDLDENQSIIVPAQNTKKPPPDFDI